MIPARSLLCSIFAVPPHNPLSLTSLISHAFLVRIHLQHVLGPVRVMLQHRQRRQSGIISILAGLLLPVLANGKRSAQSIACISNLHQIGVALTTYVQDNNDRLPVCAGYLPSHLSQLPPLTTTLFPGQPTNKLFQCPADKTIFPVELTSYEWNFWLNDAPYSAPQWATIYTNEASVIVNDLFGGRDETPITGDANPYHGASGRLMGKNALYFDGRVERARIPPPIE